MFVISLIQILPDGGGGGSCGGGAADGPGGTPGGAPPGRNVVNTVGIVKLGIDEVGFTINGNGATGNGTGAGNGST